MKSVRDAKDVQKQDVAKAIGVSNATVGRWEASEVMPDDAKMERLARYFGVTAAWLRYGTEPREAPQLVPRSKGASGRAAGGDSGQKAS